jgi:hypothetical protein
MNISGSRRCVENKIIKLAPIRIVHDLSECACNHSATPNQSLVGVNKKPNRNHFNTEFFNRNNPLFSIALNHIRLFVLNTKHHWNTGPVNIAINQTHLGSAFRKPNRKIYGYRRFSDTSFSRDNSNDIFYIAQRRLILMRSHF